MSVCSQTDQASWLSCTTFFGDWNGDAAGTGGSAFAKVVGGARSLKTDLHLPIAGLSRTVFNAVCEDQCQIQGNGSGGLTPRMIQQTMWGFLSIVSIFIK